MTGHLFSGGKPPKAARQSPLQVGASATPRAPTGRVAKLIDSYLRGIFPRPETPKLIAMQIREKHATVRKEIFRMEEAGQVINVQSTGWYRAWADPSLLALAEKPEPCLHGLQIETVAPLSGWGPPRGALQATLRGDGEWAPVKSNDSAQRTEWVGGRRVTFQAYGTGTALVSVNASAKPVTFEEWPEFYGELKGLSKGVGLDLEVPTSRCVGVEFNVDWRAFFLSGVTRMKVAHFAKAWGQIYQKHRTALRMELRVAPTELTIEEAARAISILAQGAPPVRVAPATEPAPYGQEVA